MRKKGYEKREMRKKGYEEREMLSLSETGSPEKRQKKDGAPAAPKRFLFFLVTGQCHGLVSFSRGPSPFPRTGFQGILSILVCINGSKKKKKEAAPGPEGDLQRAVR